MTNDVEGNIEMSDVREKKKYIYQKEYPKENDHSIKLCQGQIRLEFKMLTAFINKEITNNICC